jgi:serine/threonine protein kinase
MFTKNKFIDKIKKKKSFEPLTPQFLIHDDKFFDNESDDEDDENDKQKVGENIGEKVGIGVGVDSGVGVDVEKEKIETEEKKLKSIQKEKIVNEIKIEEMNESLIIKLTDFGFSGFITKEDNNFNELVGSFKTAAPELIEGFNFFFF